MRHRLHTLLVPATIVLASWAMAAPGTVSAQIVAEAGDMATLSASAVTWSDLVVDGFNPGAKLTVIHGDPSGESDYAIRLRFPDGYEFPVHWHPKAEHITVLSGVFRLGMGGATDAAAIKEYLPGDFLYLPGRMPHFGGARGETVIQLHGNGPFSINLGAP